MLLAKQSLLFVKLFSIDLSLFLFLKYLHSICLNFKFFIVLRCFQHEDVLIDIVGGKLLLLYEQVECSKCLVDFVKVELWLYRCLNCCFKQIKHFVQLDYVLLFNKPAKNYQFLHLEQMIRHKEQQEIYLIIYNFFSQMDLFLDQEKAYASKQYGYCSLGDYHFNYYLLHFLLYLYGVARLVKIYYFVNIVDCLTWPLKKSCKVSCLCCDDLLKHFDIHCCQITIFIVNLLTMCFNLLKLQFEYEKSMDYSKLKVFEHALLY